MADFFSASSLVILSSSFALETTGSPAGGFGLPSTSLGTTGLPAGAFAVFAGSCGAVLPCEAAADAVFLAAAFFISGSVILAAFTVTFGSSSFFSVSFFLPVLLLATLVSFLAPLLIIVFFTTIPSMSDISSSTDETSIPIDMAFSSTSASFIFNSAAKSFIFIRTSSFML